MHTLKDETVMTTARNKTATQTQASKISLMWAISKRIKRLGLSDIHPLFYRTSTQEHRCGDIALQCYFTQLLWCCGTNLAPKCALNTWNVKPFLLLLRSAKQLCVSQHSVQTTHTRKASTHCLHKRATQSLKSCLLIPRVQQPHMHCLNRVLHQHQQPAMPT